MLRMELTASDLGRIRLADGPMPLIELGSLVREVRRRRRVPDARSLVSPDDWHVVHGLMAQACSPGFVTPSLADPDAAIEEVMSTPSARLMEEFEYNAQVGHPLPSWVYELAGTGQRATRLRRALGESLRRVERAAIEPMLRRFDPYAQAHRARVSTTLLAHGSGAALNALHPKIRYHAPVLDLDLAAGAEIEVPSTDSAPSRALAALLGSTRAAVLETIAHRSGCNGHRCRREIP